LHSKIVLRQFDVSKTRLKMEARAAYGSSSDERANQPFLLIQAWQGSLLIYSDLA
jgi:hypothetical protein